VPVEIICLGTHILSVGCSLCPGGSQIERIIVEARQMRLGKASGKRIIILSLMVIFITLPYYLTVPGHVYYHTLFRDLYFLPLILSAYWFGLEAAVITAASITTIYVPFLVLNWQGFSRLDFSRMLEVLLFNAVALVLGYVSSRQKAHEKALRESESLAAMGEALSAAAHDMKSPLTAIGGITRLIYKKLQNDDESRHKLAMVIKEVDRLETLVGDNLAFSRPLRLDLARSDFNALLRESIDIVDLQTTEKHVILKTDLSERLPRVDLDALRMKQVFINLVVNALQASPEGEKVLIRTYWERDKVYLEIVDNGPGVPEQDRVKIFSPFFTTKREGTGLGLPISLKIISAHKGTLELLETSGKGATFRIALPL
jgi:two-component system, NtrC family, sensor histidine kinase HydH